MPSDFSVREWSASSGGAAALLATKPAAPAPIASASTSATGTSATSNNAAPFPLPVGHLNAVLGIEVMQFLNQAGGVTQSFPSQNQLNAYQQAALSGQTAEHDATAVA